MTNLKITNLELIKDSVKKFTETLVEKKEIVGIYSIDIRYDSEIIYHQFANSSEQEGLRIVVKFRTIYKFPKLENGTFHLLAHRSLTDKRGMDAIVEQMESNFMSQLYELRRVDGVIEECSGIVPF